MYFMILIKNMVSRHYGLIYFTIEAASSAAFSVGSHESFERLIGRNGDTPKNVRPNIQINLKSSKTIHFTSEYFSRKARALKNSPEKKSSQNIKNPWLLNFLNGKLRNSCFQVFLKYLMAEIKPRRFSSVNLIILPTFKE